MRKTIHLVSMTIEEKVIKSCSTIVAAFFPVNRVEIGLSQQRLADNQSAKGDLILRIEKIKVSDISNVFELSFDNEGQVISQQFATKIETLKNQFPLPGKEPSAQIMVKKTVFMFLAGLTGQKNPWGILNGMRPGKLITKMEELGYDNKIQEDILDHYYLVSSEKIKLLQRINTVQKPYREIKEKAKQVAVYLAIPFCPSRCSYCSFPSNPLSAKNKELIPLYLQALEQEIKLTAELMAENGLKADSIYVGGGTPTVLDVKELEELLRTICDRLPRKQEAEFTVEAGRPDTLDLSKLKLLKQYGVNRLSINPQSMQEKTLDRIGRTHGISELIDCYYMARDLSDWTINMDLIIGLPGEGFAEIIDSINKVLELIPDNLTVHAMALKRGSAVWEESYVHNSHYDWAEIEHEIEDRILSAGYYPYYLYRQKNIVGNLENIGYTLPGKVCRYNVATIEEIQNVIGLGAGAASKLPKRNYGHENIYNPQDLKNYLERFREVHAKRKRVLEGAVGIS